MVGGELAAKSQTNNRYHRRLRGVERKPLEPFLSSETLPLASFAALERRRTAVAATVPAAVL